MEALSPRLRTDTVGSGHQEAVTLRNPVPDFSREASRKSGTAESAAPKKIADYLQISPFRAITIVQCQPLFEIRLYTKNSGKSTHVTHKTGVFMRESLPASASAARDSGLTASAPALMSATTPLHVLPTTAIPESNTLWHLPSAPSQMHAFTRPASRARGARDRSSRPRRTVGNRLSHSCTPRAGRPPAPPSSAPSCLFRALVSSCLPFLLVIWSTPLRALCFYEGIDRISPASAASARSYPPLRSGPAAAGAA